MTEKLGPGVIRDLKRKLESDITEPVLRTLALVDDLAEKMDLAASIVIVGIAMLAICTIRLYPHLGIVRASEMIGKRVLDIMPDSIKGAYKAKDRMR